MLKIRLQGTLNDIQWFRRILEKHKNWMFWKYRMLMRIKEQANIFVFMLK